MPCPSRRRFLGYLLAVCLPVPAFAAEEPVKLPFEYDAARDPAKDLEVALRIARAAGRRVLIIVGGEWCSWCHVMDRFFVANQDLKRYRDANYVWLKVNWSTENHNDAFLKRYPAIKGYPHLFVLDSGDVCCSRRTRRSSRRGRTRSRGVMRVPRQVGAALGVRSRCRASAQATCSRTSGDGSSARATSAARMAGSGGALPSATAILRDQRS